MSQGDRDLVPTPLGVHPAGRTEAMAWEGTKKSPKRKGGRGEGARCRGESPQLGIRVGTSHCVRTMRTR